MYSPKDLNLIYLHNFPEVTSAFENMHLIGAIEMYVFDFDNISTIKVVQLPINLVIVDQAASPGTYTRTVLKN